MVTSVRPLFALLGLLVVASSATAQLQLFPRPSSYTIDGITLPQVAFHDGEKEVTYVPPRGWDYSGGDSRMVMHPKNKTGAEATIISMPRNPNASAAFDAEATKNLTNEAIATVPPQSTNLQVLSQEVNPVRINGKDTFLVTLSYTFGGENYARSVMFMNRATDRLVFQLVAREKDFPELQKSFLASHFTWRNL